MHWPMNALKIVNGEDDAFLRARNCPGRQVALYAALILKVLDRLVLVHEVTNPYS